MIEEMSGELEMPTPCPKCGSIFELNDGCCSEKWYPDTTICSSCRNAEILEMEEDDIIEDLNNEMSDVLLTLRDRGLSVLNKENIKELALLYMKHVAKASKDVTLDNLSKALIEVYSTPKEGSGEVFKCILCQDTGIVNIGGSFGGTGTTTTCLCKHPKKYSQISTFQTYESLRHSGMMFELHPELTGDWDRDYAEIIKPSINE